MDDELETIRRRLAELDAIIRNPNTPPPDELQAIGEAFDLIEKLDPTRRLGLLRKFALGYYYDDECHRKEGCPSAQTKTARG